MTLEGIPVLDKLSALERLDGDDQLYREIVAVFTEDVPGELDVLEKAIASNDRVVIERQAHSLKSASANIGAETMRIVCLQTEKAAKTESAENLMTLVASIRNEFQRLQGYLKHSA